MASKGLSRMDTAIVSFTGLLICPIIIALPAGVWAWAAEVAPQARTNPVAHVKIEIDFRFIAH